MQDNFVCGIRASFEVPKTGNSASGIDDSSMFINPGTAPKNTAKIVAKPLHREPTALLALVSRIKPENDDMKAWYQIAVDWKRSEA
jgi:hypothetical protein